MEYRIDKKGDCLVLKIERDITIYEVNHFKQAFDDVRKHKDTSRQIIIDMQKVGYIDALALGALTAFSQEIREKGGDVKITGMNEDIKNIFRLSQLSKIYEVFSSVDEAAKSFK